MSQLQENADQDPLLDAIQRYAQVVCWFLWLLPEWCEEYTGLGNGPEIIDQF